MSNESLLFDIAYQLWNKGYISNNNKMLAITNKNINPTVYDQYVFIRRMFKPIWLYYILLIRTITLKITIEDIRSLIKTRMIEKIDLNKPNFIYRDYENYDSQLLNNNTLITVIIPTLNRYNYLKEALIDLENQDYKNFEILVIDQSKPFKSKFYENLDLNIRVIQQTEESLWMARNLGIKKASGDMILFFDDDSRVKMDWIKQHIKCLDYFEADISAGVSISKSGGRVPKHYNYFRWGDQLDTGNCMIKKEVFIKCGLFDRQFEKMRMGDGEFGARAYTNGFRIINNPKASRFHIKADSGGLRTMAGWDAMRPSKFYKPRPIPSVLYFFRNYWGNSLAVLYIIQALPYSNSPYYLKDKKLGKIISLLFFFFFLPLIIFQVLISWRLASKMISKGPNIDIIE